MTIYMNTGSCCTYVNSGSNTGIHVLMSRPDKCMITDSRNHIIGNHTKKNKFITKRTITFVETCMQLIVLVNIRLRQLQNVSQTME